MALMWSVAEVANADELHSSDYEWAVTESLIFATMGIGMRRITVANAEKFAERLWMWQAIVDGMVARRRTEGGVASSRIGYADVVRRIGLTTNASEETDAAWAKRITEHLRREARYAVSREVDSPREKVAEAAL